MLIERGNRGSVARPAEDQQPRLRRRDKYWLGQLVKGAVADAAGSGIMYVTPIGHKAALVIGGLVFLGHEAAMITMWCCERNGPQPVIEVEAKPIDPFKSDPKRQELLRDIASLRERIEQRTAEHLALAEEPTRKVGGPGKKSPPNRKQTRDDVSENFAREGRRDQGVAAAQNRVDSLKPLLDSKIADYADQSTTVLEDQVAEVQRRLLAYAANPRGARYEDVVREAHLLAGHAEALREELNGFAQVSSTQEAGLHVLPALTAVLDNLETAKQDALDGIDRRDFFTT
jgi:hypothetical protein